MTNTEEAKVPQTRNTQTKALIKHALTELIHKKGFDALTVSDITRCAHINRGTFYLHYIDKFDMLQQIEDDMIAALTDALINEDSARDARTADDLFPYPVLLAGLKTVCDDFDFVAAIAGPGGDPEFHSKLKRIIGGLLDKCMSYAGGEVLCDTFSYPYARELVICHVVTIINLWLERGGKESPEEVARMIVTAKDVYPCQLVRLPGDKLAKAE